MNDASTRKGLDGNAALVKDGHDDSPVRQDLPDSAEVGLQAVFRDAERLSGGRHAQAVSRLIADRPAPLDGIQASFLKADDNGLPINTTWDNIKDNLSLVLYPITDKKAIRALATQREGLKAFSRDRDGNPTFYDIRPLELNKLVGDCSFATISRRKERTTGFGLMLCYTDVKANTVSRTSELYSCRR